MLSGKEFFKFAVLLSACMATVCTAFRLQFSEPWIAYKTVHGKTYQDEEDFRRMDAFKSNAAFVIKHNLEADMGKHTYRVALNKFSDLPLDELRKIIRNISLEDVPNNSEDLDVPGNAPEELDLRKLKLVTEVKNQVACTSAYAFAAMASLEGMWKKAKNELESLSAQNIVDCSRRQGNSGCDGGMPTASFQYVAENSGVEKWDSYPYIGEEQQCQYNKTGFGASCRTYIRLLQATEENLKRATAFYGPTVVTFHAQSESFMMYKSGVYYDPISCHGGIDHYMVSVGYGKEKDMDYWLIKNSFGTEWGDEGYIKTARNKDNHCGIISEISFPHV